MAVNKENYKTILSELGDGITLVAVSKMKSLEEIKQLYELGQRDFGENYVQELLEKQAALPEDIRWHFIGHLQSNKVKFIVPFIHLIHGVDSHNLLKEVNKQGKKINRQVDVLLQVHIAEEETKFGLNEAELAEVITAAEQYSNVQIRGLMGMASFSDDMEKVRNEFGSLQRLFKQYQTATAGAPFSYLSMGMSNDYLLAKEMGTNMVRIGSLLFGPRMKKQD